MEVLLVGLSQVPSLNEPETLRLLGQLRLDAAGLQELREAIVAVADAALGGFPIDVYTVDYAFADPLLNRFVGQPARVFRFVQRTGVHVPGTLLDFPAVLVYPSAAAGLHMAEVYTREILQAELLGKPSMFRRVLPEIGEYRRPGLGSVLECLPWHGTFIFRENRVDIVRAGRLEATRPASPHEVDLLLLPPKRRLPSHRPRPRYAGATGDQTCCCRRNCQAREPTETTHAFVAHIHPP